MIPGLRYCLDQQVLQGFGKVRSNQIAGTIENSRGQST